MHSLHACPLELVRNQHSSTVNSSTASVDHLEKGIVHSITVDCAYRNCITKDRYIYEKFKINT